MTSPHAGPLPSSLSGTGVWSGALRYGDPAEAAEHAAELEELGYEALWLPDVGGDVMAAVENLLQATSSVTVATGILNLWMHEPGEVAASHARLGEVYGHRFLLGIGVSHQVLIDLAEEGRYRKPLTAMRTFLDGLDAAETPVPQDERVLAALGPKMVQLAKERSAGAHPYLVTSSDTARIREGLGPDRLLAPELTVVLDPDPVTARPTARTLLSGYTALPNYNKQWLAEGFTEADLEGGGSDRLVDALVVWGDEQAIADRVQAYRDAGADHVCIQVVTGDRAGSAMDELRRLAPILT